MNKLFQLVGCLALIVAVGSLSAADKADKAEKKLDPENIFKKLDADGDGKLTLDELKKIGDHFERFKDKEDKILKRLDTDNDGKISLDEFKKIAELRDKKNNK